MQQQKTLEEGQRSLVPSRPILGTLACLSVNFQRKISMPMAEVTELKSSKTHYRSSACQLTRAALGRSRKPWKRYNPLTYRGFMKELMVRLLLMINWHDLNVRRVLRPSSMLIDLEYRIKNSLGFRKDKKSRWKAWNSENRSLERQSEVTPLCQHTIARNLARPIWWAYLV